MDAVQQGQEIHEDRPGKRPTLDEIDDDSTCEGLNSSGLPPNYEKRRELFHVGIKAITREIVSLKNGMEDIDNRRYLLSLQIPKQHQRVLYLQAELYRVGSCAGPEIRSSAIHGAEQTFPKKKLEKELSTELEKTRSSIAQWTREIIQGIKEKKRMSDRIHHQENLLKERGESLRRFELMGENIVKLGKQVCFRSDEKIIQYYFFQWSKQATKRSRFRRILRPLFGGEKSLRLEAMAFRKWRQLEKVTKVDQECTGRGDILLWRVAAHRSNVVEAASNALQELTQMKRQSPIELLDFDKFDVQRGLMEHDTAWMSELPPAPLTSVIEGDTMFNSQQYEDSLNCYLAALEHLRDNHIDPQSMHDICQAYIYGRLGNAHAKRGQWSQAIMYHERQCVIASEVRSAKCEIEARLNLGHDFQGDLEYICAKEYFEEALAKSISVEDKDLQAFSHRALQVICEKLNDMDGASRNGKACSDIMFKRKDKIAAAIGAADELKARLMHANATEENVIMLEKVTPSYVTLRKEQHGLQRRIAEANNEIQGIRLEASKIRDSLKEVNDELKECRSKVDRKVRSGRVHGLEQVVDAGELGKHLESQAIKIRAQLDTIITREKQKDTDILNLLDDQENLKKDISVEQGPLMTRVLGDRVFRSMQFSATNTAINDVGCRTSNAIPCVVASEGSSIYIHNLHSGEQQMVFCGDEHHERHVGEPLGHKSVVTCLFFHGKFVYSGSMDKTIMCWDIGTEKRVFVATRHEGTVTCLWVDNEKMVSGSADSSIIIWNKDDGTMYRRVFGHLRGILSLECGLTWCVSGGSDGDIFVWQCLAHSDDPSFAEIVSGDNHGNVSIWWSKSGERIQKCRPHKGSVISLQFDATRIVSAGRDGNVCVIDVFSGSILATLQSSCVRVEAIAFDTDCILSACVDGSIHYYHWPSSLLSDEPATSKKDTSHVRSTDDTLRSISKKYGILLDDFLRRNGIEDVTMLQTGQQLDFTKPEAHKEQKEQQSSNNMHNTNPKSKKWRGVDSSERRKQRVDSSNKHCGSLANRLLQNSQHMHHEES